MNNRKFKRRNRQGGIRNRNQDRTHAPIPQATISIYRPFYRHVPDLDIETQRVFLNKTVWDMNAVSYWVAEQENALPRPPYTADQKNLIEVLRQVKNLLANTELLLILYQRRKRRKS